VADILDDLNESQAEELLQNMDAETSSEVREIMEYPEKTAGAIMSTDFAHFPSSAAVGTVLSELKRLDLDPEDISVIYVTSDKEELVASISLAQIATANDDLTLAHFVTEAPKFANDSDNHHQLLELIAKYSLPALPVVDLDKKLVGQVLVHELLEQLIRAQGLEV
jgi:magnesium transporter